VAESGADWDAALTTALKEAAQASSPAATHAALAHLVAAIKDDHAKVLHLGAPTSGGLPLALRPFDDSLFVVGGLAPYLAATPVGSEIVSIDGEPIVTAYRRAYEQVSAATEGWRKYAAPIYMGMGRVGALTSLGVRSGEKKVSEVVVPLVPREVLLAQVRESRPASGTELSPGIYYVDLEGLSADTWAALVNKLTGARAIIFDVRGYITNTAFDAISHFAERELASPSFHVPLVGVPGAREFAQYGWSLEPSSPHLRSRALFLADGRSASAPETLLQIVREHELGTIVGEPTGGTNGDINTFLTPGGFTVRFTGLRVQFPDGSTVHGHGIIPDHIVHPTLAAIVVGEDEILDAAVALVK
jgi:hypothetical protein